MTLVFASNNAHKLAEVRNIMPAGIDVLSLHDIGFEQEIEENGTTLEENSKIKAETVCQWLKSSNRQSSNRQSIDGVFADDTGLEIDALGGKPGVYTARWYRLNDGMSAALNDEMSATKSLNDIELNWLRAEIDELDETLWETIAARMDVSKRIGEWKKAHGVAPLQPERFQQILTQRIKWAQANDLDNEFVETILNTIHKQSLNAQI